MTNSLIGVPSKLLAAFQRVKTTVTLTEAQTYNPATADVSGSPTTHTVTNASPVIYDSTRVDALAHRKGTASCFLPGSGLGFVPLLGWTLTVGSVLWKVVDVLKHAVDESNVAAWELRLER